MFKLEPPDELGDDILVAADVLEPANEGDDRTKHPAALLILFEVASASEIADVKPLNEQAVSLIEQFAEISGHAAS